MIQYGTGHSWTWDGNAQITITNSEWTAHAADSDWATYGYVHDTAAGKLTLATAEEAQMARLWEDYGRRAILPRLTTADFTTAPNFGQMMIAMMKAAADGWLGFREHLPGHTSDDVTPEAVRVGIVGMNVREARVALARPFLTAQELQNDPVLCCDAAIAYLKNTAATHSWNPMQAMALMERQRLRTVAAAENVWQLECRDRPGGGAWHNDLTKMAAAYSYSEQFNRFRS